MTFKIEYEKLNGEITIFDRCEIVGTYNKGVRTEGFKVKDLERKVFRNIRYTGLKTIEAA